MIRIIDRWLAARERRSFALQFFLSRLPIEGTQITHHALARKAVNDADCLIAALKLPASI